MHLSDVLPNGEKTRQIRFGIARGVRLNINFRRGQTRLYVGLYECELNKSIRRLALPGTPTFDIGGEYGYDALAFARLTGAPVISVESDGGLCEEIRRNAALNPDLEKYVTVRHAFIGFGAGELSLDDLVATSFVPGFVKMDIEGGEAKALRGASELLTRHRPRLLIEVHGLEVEQECRSRLDAARYSVRVVTPRTWLPDYRPISHNQWLIALPN